MDGTDAVTMFRQLAGDLTVGKDPIRFGFCAETRGQVPHAGLKCRDRSGIGRLQNNCV